MPEDLTITTEQVDDVPLLLGMMQQMDLPNLIDGAFAQHANWQGLDRGWTTCIWLAHILSQANHRLSYVQAWVARCLFTLSQICGRTLRPLDFSDDRLASLLRRFSDDYYWNQFEAALNRRLLRVYDLPAERVRLDSSTASGYWGADENGLLQFGHSKDKRPDLRQIKVMLATLDPLPLPLVTNVLPGNAADDPLYGPAIAQVRTGVRRHGLLYVGDCKMAAIQTRGFVVDGADFYLCPLPAKQLPANWQAEYVDPLLREEQPLSAVVRAGADGTAAEIAVGYERSAPQETTVDGQAVKWVERRLVVRSLAAARSAEEKLRRRLAAATTQLLALNERGRGKQRPADLAALQAACAAIVAGQEVGAWLRVEIAECWVERRVRGYLGRPARVERRWDYQLTVLVDEAALAASIARLGWRVYATNQDAAALTLEEAVLLYREEYLVEQSFGRLKGAPLSLRPCYLQRDEHIKGLVRLLGLGVRVLSLLEFVVRRGLANEGAELTGLYEGQPRMSTARPTAERLLASFKGLTLTVIRWAEQVIYHLTALSALQERILALLGFTPEIYRKITVVFAQPP